LFFYLAFVGEKTFHLFWVKAPLSQGRPALLYSRTAWPQISHENEWFDDFFFIFVIVLTIDSFLGTSYIHLS
jgi:hypothetical protein